MHNKSSSMNTVDGFSPSNMTLLHLYNVDVSWSYWGAWSACTATCGDSSSRRRSRQCEGEDTACPGEGNQTESCTVKPCRGMLTCQYGLSHLHYYKACKASTVAIHSQYYFNNMVLVVSTNW